MCVCVCVCEWERETERDRQTDRQKGEKQKDRERLNGGKKMNGILGDSSNRANREKEKKWKRKNLQWNNFKTYPRTREHEFTYYTN